MASTYQHVRTRRIPLGSFSLNLSLSSAPSAVLMRLGMFLLLSALFGLARSQGNQSKPVRLQQVFAIEPSDRTAIVGTPVVLSCRVLHKAGTLQWTRDGFGLGSDRELRGFPRYSMIGSDDEGDFSLQIGYVTLDDDAMFQCQVGASDGIKGIRSRNAQFTVYVPPEGPQIVQGDYLKTTAGMTVELTCESNAGKPPAELTWIDGEDNVVTTDIEYSTHPLPDGKRANAALKWTFTPKREHDGKTFTCRSENPALKQPLFARIKMEVKYPPEISLSVATDRVKEHEPVRFSCEAMANPSDVVYKWYRNDEIVVGDHSTSFTIPRVTKDFHGDTISCEVSNSVGTSKATHTLNVEFGPTFKESIKTVAADVGSDVTLKCEAEGNPKPDIVWTFENSPKVLSTQRTLTISSVTTDNAGKYTCKASVPDFALKMTDIMLYIKGPPKIKSPLVQFGLEKEIIKVECVINSVPAPTKIMWFSNNQVIDTDNNEGFEKVEEILKDGVKNVLVKHKAEEKDFGIYNCSVWNAFGHDSALISVQKQKSMPLLLISSGIIGGIVFVVSFTIIIVLCLRKKAVIKDEEFGSEKKSAKQSDSGSSNDSDLKAEIRTSSSMSNHERSWEDDSRSHETQEVYNKYGSDYTEPVFPPKPESQGNNGYIPYVDYTRDYNPPNTGTLAGSRDSGLYGSSPHSLTDLTLDPRYRAAYANPYLRTSQSPLPIPPGVYVTSWNSEAQQQANNHYITSQQAQLKPGTLATHV